MRTLFLISLFFMLAVPHGALAEECKLTAYGLFKAGKIDAAREAFEAGIADAAHTKDDRELWQAYMYAAWFRDEISEHRQAIEYSNKALQVATKTKDSFLIGRSLCWLGWAYSGLGMYEMAEAFYQNAVELGAPQGKIVHVHVWGLAQQELGAIKIKEGKIAEGRRLLLETYNYAEQNGIDAGVSEGGTHLAELALAEGKYSEAEDYAQKAVDAAKRCDCSPYNLTEAEVIRLKANIERSRFNGEPVDALRQQADELLAECDQRHQLRCVAETKILKSKLLPEADFDKRFELVSSAFEALANNENEVRGAAEAELGAVFLEKQDTELAKFYLQHGLQVSKEMLRKVDVAFIRGDLAKIDGLNRKHGSEVNKLNAAIAQTMKAKALPRTLELQVDLVRLLEKLGYVQFGIQGTEDALNTVHKLIAQNPPDSPAYKHFKQVELELKEHMISMQLQFERESSEQPE